MSCQCFETEFGMGVLNETSWTWLKIFQWNEKIWKGVEWKLKYPQAFWLSRAVDNFNLTLYNLNKWDIYISLSVNKHILHLCIMTNMINLPIADGSLTCFCSWDVELKAQLSPYWSYTPVFQFIYLMFSCAVRFPFPAQMQYITSPSHFLVLAHSRTWVARLKGLPGTKKRSWMCATSLGGRLQDHISGYFWKQLQIKALY